MRVCSRSSRFLAFTRDAKCFATGGTSGFWNWTKKRPHTFPFRSEAGALGRVVEEAEATDADDIAEARGVQQGQLQGGYCRALETSR